MLKPFLRIALAVCLAGTAAEAAAPKPNIIFVLVDDMGYGDLGVFYQNSRNFAVNRNLPAFVTPKLDQLANEGMRLTRHYCPAPVCAPSRASLVLGVHQGHANVRDNQFDKELENNHTLATVLKQAGYATANIGKWGLQGGSGFPGHPQNRGFDKFFGILSHEDGHLHYPKEEGAQVHDGFTDVTAQLDKCYSTDLLTAQAKKWITELHTTAPTVPFFLYLAYTAPHARLDVPTQAYPAGGGLSGGIQWTGTPGAAINTASGTINTWIHPDYANATWDNDNNAATAEVAWPDYAKRHATMIRRVDDAMADLRTLLADLSIADNTLIVFTSDNGPHNEAGTGGSYTYNPTFFRSYAGFDGIKRDMWEGGVRMPTIVNWPAEIAAGSQNASPSQFQDWMPTFAELAGVPKPERSDGVSLVPTLTGMGTQQTGIIYSEYSYGGSTPNYANFESSHITTRGQMQMLQLGNYKGVRYDTTSQATDFRIYNVATDPKETTDLTGQAGVPTQQQFKDRVLQVRRAGGGVTRPYDSELVPGISGLQVVNGLEYKAYEMATPYVPDWERQTAAASGITTSLDLGLRTRATDIGMFYSGYLQVPADGDYTFYLSTDTAAFVRLHDAQLIDADFAYTAGSEVNSGSIKLKAGRHPLRIYYRHGSAATNSLSLQWSGPSIAKQAIPASAFYRPGIPVPVPPTANPDTVSTSGPALINVLANDFDDGDPAPLSISNVGFPAHGTASIEGSSIRYTPVAGFLGEDRFDYSITDGQDTRTTTVTITVLPTTDLIWLPLDETEGTVVHDALDQAIGTLNGFPPSPWVAGKLGNALTFDGTDDRLTLGGKKGVTGNAARTVSFWVNASGSQIAGTRPTMVSWGASNGAAAGTRFDINLNHTNGYKLRAEFNSAGVNFTTASRSDLRGTGWVHCAVVVPASGTVSQILAYLDGVAATTTIEPAGSGTVAINTTSANDIAIGRISDGTTARAFGGLIDDVRIYPRALDAAEIAALAAATPELDSRNRWFFRSSGNPSPGPADWNMDLDGDGMNNTLEYALGGNPTTAEISIAPALAGRTFSFNRRRDGISPASYFPETSGTLAPGSWSPLAGATASNHPTLAGFDLVTVPLPENNPCYVRLRVEP
ncbi:sulfatase-like hydrolase/transferase [Haloferula sp. BvORR071]|uniref:sulfatase-like hydrolase/transferase n=1 Tax=Haloferula sp. BvORR071 TaxID=1396141 RepID=UPI00094663E5|nr:sulfatase-like hydrolase/transferase [Haloferula sp. BvORR071]